jgi:hypothetical protein
MFTSEQCLQVAQYLQPSLSDLLSVERAKTIDLQLTELISKAESGERVEREILALLYSEESLRPYLILNTGEKHGDPKNAASSLSYKCPQCTYTAKIPFLGIKPKPCKEHPKVTLEMI